MTIQELKDLVRLKIAGQGTMVDAGGALPPVLNGILDTLAATQNVESVVVTVDGGEGTPSADATFADGVLTLAFHNLKGEKGDQGNTGSSVDYPFELVNNVTTDDATKALSAAQGVVLDGKISQLGQKLRSAAKAVTCVGINFNNTTHKAEVGGFIAAKPSGGRITNQATEVDYNFNQGNTTAVWFVYDIAQSAYRFITAGYSSLDQIPLAALEIKGNSSATPNTSAVVVVYWCACENFTVDGVGIETKIKAVDAIASNLSGQMDYNQSQPAFVVENGTLYQGYDYAAKDCLRQANFMPVVGIKKLLVYHASDILIRIVEYSTPVTAGYIKQTDYSQFDTIELDANTKFVRIAANYAGRGYGDSNPVSPSDYQVGDFGIVQQSSVLVGTLNGALIDTFEDKTIFVDGSTWKYATSYRARIIPVTGGGTIVCTARSDVHARIAFLNSFDEAIIRGSLPVAVDGTGNNIVPAGTTKTFIIPSTCTYIALNSWYSQASLPVQLMIDGIEYMLPIQQQIVNLNNSVGQVSALAAEVDNIQEGGFASIIGRNIDKDAAVRATGTKAVSTDILPLSLIHISDIHTKGDNYKCFVNACEFYQHYSKIKAMIVTGDIVWDDFRNGMEYYDEAITNTSKPVLNVIGNHDAGQWHTNLSSVSTDKQCYDKFIAPYVSGWGVVQPSNAATDGKLYYYKDFSDEKIRLIVLCEFETDYQIDPNDATKLLYSREYRAMRQAQVTWLIDTLTNTPSDYGVIVAMHQTPGLMGAADNQFVSFDLVDNQQAFNVYSDDKEWLAKILNAFANKTSLSLSVSQTGAVVTTLDCSCDFSAVQSEFICVLCGHTHRDYIGRLKNYQSIPVLCVGADNLLYTSSFQPREAGTPSEDLFNVINIDRNRKTIKVVRIGSDASVTGQVRDQLLLNYANN